MKNMFLKIILLFFKIGFSFLKYLQKVEDEVRFVANLIKFNKNIMKPLNLI